MPGYAPLALPSVASRPDLASSISNVVASAWAPSTLSLYGRGVRRFYEWAAGAQIPPLCCLPANEFSLCAFVAASAGLRSGGAIRSDVNGVRALHILHGAVWLGGLRLEYCLKAADRMTPSSSSRPLRPPVTQEMMDVLCTSLDPTVPLFAAVLAAACFSYWGQCRLGEALPDSLARFSSARHPTPSCLRPCTASGRSRICHLPSTKCAVSAGEDVFLSAQRGPSSSLAALDNQLSVNRPGADSHLFGYTEGGAFLPLTKRKFLAVCNAVWSPHGFPSISGHCFRIGGTTEMLLRGVPPHLVQMLGRWRSDAFLRYWRTLENIAPAHVELLGDRRPSLPTSLAPPRRR